MSTVTVLCVVGGTVREETYTADKITFQHREGGRLHLKLWRGGRVAEQISYLRAEWLRRVDFEEPA